MRLALATGQPDVRKIMALPSTIIDLWIAYHAIAPFGTERDNLHAGMIAAAVYNVHRGRGKPLQPDDFLLQFAKPQQRTADDLYQTLRTWFVLRGAAVDKSDMMQ